MHLDYSRDEPNSLVMSGFFEEVRSLENLKFMGDAIVTDTETICANFATAKSRIP